MSCFENIINIKGTCADPVSVSGLWLNSIGISVKEIEKYITSDFAGVDDFVQDKIAFASTIVTDRVYNHLTDKFKTSSILESQIIGHFQDNKSIVAAEAKYKGFQVEIVNVDTFVKFYLSDLSIFVNYTGTVEVKVYDLIQAKVIDTLSIEAVAGEIVAEYFHKTYYSNRNKLHLAFIYDASDVPSYNTTTSANYCNSCDLVKSWMNKYVRATGISATLASEKIKSNIRQEANTAGLSINYSVQCNHRGWICTFANAMALPILWRTAYEIMSFAINNAEQVNIRTMDVEKLKSRKEEYDFEYQKSKSNLLKNLKLPTDSLCFECNIKSKHVTMLP